MEGKNQFHAQLKLKIHKFIMSCYTITEQFPKTEIYGTTNQLRRASVSIMLNYVEGFARFKPKVKLNFFEIAYGSARECKYLIFLAKEKEWINLIEYNNQLKLIEEIGAMMWSIITGLNKQINEY